MLNMKKIFLISICSIFICSCTSNRRAIYCRFIESHKYEDVINGATHLAQIKQDYNDKARYWLLAGIAYQRVGQFEQSLFCFNKSLFYEKKYNYFAYQYKAQILKMENDIKSEKINLILALECIDRLIAKIQKYNKNKYFWQMFYKTNIYSTFDFSVGYHIENNSIEDQHKSFIERLNKRKNSIEQAISQESQPKMVP